MPDVNVIRPNGSVESALTENELPAESEAVRVLGFPKYLAEFDVEIERKMLQNRETGTSVTVDLLTGTCGANDIYPDLQTRTLSSTSLLNPRLERETAAEKAHTFVRRRINRKYKSFTAPDIEPARTDTVFKLFWVAPASTRDTVHVIDTITDELVAEDVELDALTEDPSPAP